MKLNKEFIPHESHGEVMLIATGNTKFSGLVRGNKILGDVLELLREETTEAEIVKKMRDKYDAPEGKIEGDVHKVITELSKIGAIV
ncbi:PqqD family protein [uncultured Ruminococcus sp.]|uniref:PqqD family protein n=1 Tax=uncultured Ruminococcus sp. TaxID=165186 RepID=UPI00260086C7|nr:PqqD family protein [uncultured Ruminococcus sp.]